MVAGFAYVGGGTLQQESVVRTQEYGIFKVQYDFNTQFFANDEDTVVYLLGTPGRTRIVQENEGIVPASFIASITPQQRILAYSRSMADGNLITGTLHFGKLTQHFGFGAQPRELSIPQLALHLHHLPHPDLDEILQHHKRWTQRHDLIPDKGLAPRLSKLYGEFCNSSPA